MVRITDFPELANPVVGDKIHVVDVSDTSAHAEGTSKYLDIGNLPTAIKEHDTVAAMVADTGLAVGNMVLTQGYTTAGDGGAARYRIVAAATGRDGGGFYHDLTGTNGPAEPMPHRRVSIKWFA